MGSRRTTRVGAVLAAVLALTACSAPVAATVPVARPGTAGYHGTEPDQVRARPSFTLTDTSGRPYDLARATAGRPTYLYFGYTHCPDACPAALADLASALRRQPAALRSQARVVFVTTDAARDTPPVMRRFLDRFSPAFVGLTGTQAQVDAAAKAAGLYTATKVTAGPRSTAGPSRSAGYAVEHLDVTMAFDAGDHLAVLYTGSSSPADIAADLPALARMKDDT